MVQLAAEGAALGQRQGAHVHRLEGEGHLGLEQMCVPLVTESIGPKIITSHGLLVTG